MRVNERAGSRSTIVTVIAFGAAAVASFLTIRWAYDQWGLVGGFVALMLAPETVGYVAYMVVAMVLGVPLALFSARGAERVDSAVGSDASHPNVLTIPVSGVGPVTFIRRPDGEVSFELDPAKSNWLTAGIVTREGYLELTKRQVAAGLQDVWCPDLLEKVREGLAIETMTTDEYGREVRAFVSDGHVIKFVRADDGSVSREPDSDIQPENQRQALKRSLEAEGAPLALTKLQVRRGEPPWFPELREQAASQLVREGFELPTTR